jgi:hypothetical protein
MSKTLNIVHRAGALLLELLRDADPVGIAVFDANGDYLVYPPADSIADGFTVEATEVAGEPVVLARVSLAESSQESLETPHRYGDWQNLIIIDEHDVEGVRKAGDAYLCHAEDAVRFLMAIIHDRGVQLSLRNLGYPIDLPEDVR